MKFKPYSLILLNLCYIYISVDLCYKAVYHAKIAQCTHFFLRLSQYYFLSKVIGSNIITYGFLIG